MIYIYLPIKELIFDQSCTVAFLEDAQKLLVLGYIQPTMMGIFMLIIILFFAKDEKARAELRYSMEQEASVSGDVVDNDDSLDGLSDINKGIAEEEQEQIQ